MKTRAIHTRIWQDDWFASLTASEKVLFMYLLTNKEVNLNGVYELSDRVIMFETGLSKDILEKAKVTFRDKILIENGWVIIKNLQKYDDYKSPTLKIAKENQLNDIPSEIRDRVSEYRNSPSIGYQEKGIGYAYPNSNSKSNNNINNNNILEKEIVKRKNLLLEDLTDEVLEEISLRYNVPLAFVRSKLEDLQNYCASKGKTYKDYKAALSDWVKKDAFKLKTEVSIQSRKVAVQT